MEAAKKKGVRKERLWTIARGNAKGELGGAMVVVVEKESMKKGSREAGKGLAF